MEEERKKAIVQLPFSSLKLNLFADVEVSDQLPVPLDIGFAEIIQEAPALTDKRDEGALGGKILGRHLHVRSQFIDALGKNSNLGFRIAGVCFGISVLFKDRFLLFSS